ncbi:MAG: MFS transporter [Chloroflexota bacterium]
MVCRPGLPHTGNWILSVALPVYVYRVTGSTLATGTMLMAGLLPHVLFGSVAGIFVDRWDRRCTLIVTTLALAVAILPLLAVRSSSWLWIVYVVAFAESSLSQLLVAETALLPNLVDTANLVPANSLNALNQNASRLIGPALGGLLVAVVGLSAVAAIDAATYLFAALMTIPIRAPVGVEPVPDKSSRINWAGEGGWATMWREWVEGLRLVRRQRLLYGVFAVLALSGLAEGVLAPLFVAFGTKIVHGGS